MNEIEFPVYKRNGSYLLISDRPYIIDRMLAVKIGLHEAILLVQLHYWLHKNQQKGQNIRDGRVWCYNSYKEWASDLLFLSQDQVQRAFLSLEKLGLVISKKFEAKNWNQRKWYTIDYVVLSKLQVPDFFDHANTDDQTCIPAASKMQKCEIEDASMHKHYNIAETNSEISADTTDAVDRLLHLLPRNLQLDVQVRSWITSTVAANGVEYTMSNIQVTNAKSTKNPKFFLQKALEQDYGKECRAKKMAENEIKQRESEIKSKEEMIEREKMARERAIFQALSAGEREEILDLARTTSPSAIPQMVEATAFKIMIKRLNQSD